jgi:hypothetical protein
MKVYGRKKIGPNSTPLYIPVSSKGSLSIYLALYRSQKVTKKGIFLHD